MDSTEAMQGFVVAEGQWTKGRFKCGTKLSGQGPQAALARLPLVFYRNSSAMKSFMACQERLSAFSL